MGRTNIVIDDALIEQAIALTGAKSKRQAIDIALKRLVSLTKAYRALRKMKGKHQWEGDISAWRRSRM